MIRTNAAVLERLVQCTDQTMAQALFDELLGERMSRECTQDKGRAAHALRGDILFLGGTP